MDEPERGGTHISKNIQEKLLALTHFKQRSSAFADKIEPGKHLEPRMSKGRRWHKTLVHHTVS